MKTTLAFIITALLYLGGCSSGASADIVGPPPQPAVHFQDIHIEPSVDGPYFTVLLTATDSKGNPAGNVQVQWTPQTGDTATLSTLSDAYGQALNDWHMAAIAGVHRIKVSVLGMTGDTTLTYDLEPIVDTPPPPAPAPPPPPPPPSIQPPFHWVSTFDNVDMHTNVPYDFRLHVVFNVVDANGQIVESYAPVAVTSAVPDNNGSCFWPDSTQMAIVECTGFGTARMMVQQPSSAHTVNNPEYRASLEVTIDP